MKASWPLKVVSIATVLHRKKMLPQHFSFVPLQFLCKLSGQLVFIKFIGYQIVESLQIWVDTKPFK